MANSILRKQDFSLTKSVICQPYSITSLGPEGRIVQQGCVVKLEKIAGALHDEDVETFRNLAEVLDTLGALNINTTQISAQKFNRLIDKAEGLIGELASRCFVISGAILPARREAANYSVKNNGE